LTAKAQFCAVEKEKKMGSVVLAVKRRNIMESTDQLAKKAIGLRPTERIRLVEAILYSLDKPDSDIEKSWIAEAEARYEAYKRGELETINWDEINKRYER
jgi:putative addiction module component (TIGR02574 family)